MPKLPGFERNEQDERSYRRRNTKVRRRWRRWKMRLLEPETYRRVKRLEDWARNQSKEDA